MSDWLSVPSSAKYIVSGRPLPAGLADVKPWRWFIAPGCYFQVDAVPNRFHRWMQRVFLGLHWERNPHAPT